MNKDELKKKIMEVLNKNFTEEVECTPVYTTDDGKEIELPEELCEMFNDIVTQAVIPYFADALIAAGIGDVKEAEHRAARAERALNDCVEYYSWSGLCPVLGCNYNKACWQKKCTSDIAQCFKIQAEQELA